MRVISSPSISTSGVVIAIFVTGPPRVSELLGAYATAKPNRRAPQFAQKQGCNAEGSEGNCGKALVSEIMDKPGQDARLSEFEDAPRVIAEPENSDKRAFCPEGMLSVGVFERGDFLDKGSAVGLQFLLAHAGHVEECRLRRGAGGGEGSQG